ncbi:MAG: hypothetical protein AAF919_13765 [Pseudomonadota bacterium]
MEIKTAGQEDAEQYSSGAYAVFGQDHRAGGTFCILMFGVQQGAAEKIDPSVPEIPLGTALKPWGSFEIEMSDGSRSHEARTARFVEVQPMHAESWFHLLDLHLRSALVDDVRIGRLLSDIGTHAGAC